MNRLPNEPAYPEPPDHLGDIAAQHWRQLMVRLSKYQRPDRLDHTNIASLCIQHELICRIYQRLLDDGLTVDVITEAGAKEVKHPLLDQLSKSQQQYKDIGKLYGLDPVSREKLGLELVKQPQPMDALLN